MRMIPISAAMAEPARATTMIAVNTGPISRIRVRETIDPREPVEPYIART